MNEENLKRFKMLSFNVILRRFDTEKYKAANATSDQSVKVSADTAVFTELHFMVYRVNKMYSLQRVFLISF